MIFFNFVLDSFWVHASILTPFLAWNKSFHWLIDSFDICYYVGICHGGSDMLMSAYKRGLDFQLSRKLFCIKMNSPVSHIEMCHKVTFVNIYWEETDYITIHSLHCWLFPFSSPALWTLSFPARISILPSFSLSTNHTTSISSSLLSAFFLNRLLVLLRNCRSDCM